MSKSPETTQPTQPFSITKPLGVKPLFKLDEEAEIQTNQLQNRPPSCARSGGTIKNRLAKTPNKLDEEAGTQAKSG